MAMEGRLHKTQCSILFDLLLFSLTFHMIVALFHVLLHVLV